MAKCPRCNKQWQWSYDKGTYLTPEGAYSRTLDFPEGNFGRVEERHFYCWCGFRMGFTYLDEEDAFFELHQCCDEWQNITDWKTDEMEYRE